jgi:hypothetical protein
MTDVKFHYSSFLASSMAFKASLDILSISPVGCSPFIPPTSARGEDCWLGRRKTGLRRESRAGEEGLKIDAKGLNLPRRSLYGLCLSVPWLRRHTLL